MKTAISALVAYKMRPLHRQQTGIPDPVGIASGGLARPLLTGDMQTATIDGTNDDP
jgi:hypothetical protein